jgi:tetratricopeptide (TPR) repeat protein
MNNNWSIGYWILWGIVLLLLIFVIFWDFIPTDSGIEVFLFTLFIGIFLLPMLNKIKIGSMFEIEMKDVQIKDIQTNEISSTTKANEELAKKLKVAESLFKQNRIIEAINLYKEIFEKDSNNWVIAKNLGFLYLSLIDLGVDRSEWGFSDEERLANSMLFSGFAALKDKTHFTHYLNLAIAQKHTGCQGLLVLALKNMKIAQNILKIDKSTRTNPILLFNLGKVTSILGEFEEASGNMDQAIAYRKQALEILKSCPTPYSREVIHWIDQTNRAIENLTA